MQKYQISKVINKGSTATVFHGKNNENGNEYAFKVVERKAETEPALRCELRTQLRLNHPNVTRIHDVIQLPSHTILVLDHCSGGDLLDRMPPSSGYLEAEALTYFSQLLDALDYLHENEVVHRDIKLENLCLDKSGRQLFLIDFGFACFTHDQDTSSFAGSIQGLAPELVSAYLQGQRPTTIDWKAVDVWGAGCVLYQLLTGDYPWEMASPTCPEFQHYVAGVNVPWEDLQLSQLSTALLASTLRIDPRQRPTTPNLKKVMQAAFASLGVKMTLSRCSSNVEVRARRMSQSKERFPGKNLNPPPILAVRGRAVSEGDLRMQQSQASMQDSMDMDEFSFKSAAPRTFFPSQLNLMQTNNDVNDNVAFLSPLVGVDGDLSGARGRDDLMWGSPRAVTVGLGI